MIVIPGISEMLSMKGYQSEVSQELPTNDLGSNRDSRQGDDPSPVTRDTNRESEANQESQISRPHLRQAPETNEVHEGQGTSYE